MNAQVKPSNWRLGGLGASDCAPALGLSKWCSPLELFMEKTGHTTEREATVPMQVGNALEPVALKLFSEKTGRKVTQTGERIYDPENAWRWVTLDGFSDDGGMVEAKATGLLDEWGEEGTDQIPLAYVFQTQHGLACTGRAFAWVPVLFTIHYEFRLYRIERDEEIIREMTAREYAFWQRVMNNDPPDAISSSDLALRYAKDKGTSIVATTEILERLGELHEAKASAKETAAIVEQLEVAVKTFMGEHANLTTADGKVLATWKTGKGREYIDGDKLRIDWPELSAQYTKTAKAPRTFLLKK